jgi:hypothetical protein
MRGKVIARAESYARSLSTRDSQLTTEKAASLSRRTVSSPLLPSHQKQRLKNHRSGAATIGCPAMVATNEPRNQRVRRSVRWTWEVIVSGM